MEKLKLRARLEEVQVQSSSIRVAATVRLSGGDGGMPDGLGVRARRRKAEETVDFEVVSQDLTPHSGALAVSASHGGLERGVWDVFVVVRFADEEKEIRVGAERARSIEPEGASNLSENPEPRERILAYFTKVSGNLALDCGAVLHRNLGAARAVGLTLDENSRAVLLVRTAGEPAQTDEYFGHLEGIQHHAGRHLLPAARLGDRLIGLRLPLTPDTVGATLRVTAALGGPAEPLDIGTTEYWPARAAGFGLSRMENGAAAVTPAPRRLGGLSTEPSPAVAQLLPAPAKSSISLAARGRRGASAVVRRIPGAPAVARRVQRGVKGLLK